jgi:uncharacterized membrane protein YidH (DUF202 family)
VHVLTNFDLLNDVFSSSLVPQSNFTSIGGFAYAVLNIIIGIGFSIAVIAVAYSGFMFANSSGDPKTQKKAYDTFLYGAIAMALVIGAVAVRLLISRGIFGITTEIIVNTAPPF